MTGWPVGLSTGCFYQQRISEVLETIRDGGFSMIEICSFPSHLDYHNRPVVHEAAQQLADLRMEPFSFHAPFRENIDITSLDARQRDLSLNELLVAADSAAIMGVRNFVIHPGPDRSGRPPESEYRRRMENAANALARVAAHCRRLGLQLVLENMLPHLLFGQSSDVMWIMGAIRDLNVGICLDTGHAHIAGDLYSAAPKLSGNLKMVHINDNHGHRDEHLPPGKGSVDWVRVVRQLKEISFAGGMILELSADNAEADQILLRAREARAYLEQVRRKVDGEKTG